MTKEQYEGTPELIFYCEYNPDKLEDRLEIPFTNDYDIRLDFSHDEETKEIHINVDLQPKKSNVPKGFFGKNILNVQAIIGKNGVGKTRVLKNIKKLDGEASRVGGIFVLYQYNNQIFVYNGKYDGQPSPLIFKSNDCELPKFRKFDDISTIFLNGNDFSIAPVLHIGIPKPEFLQNGVREVQQRFNHKYVMEFMDLIGVSKKYTVLVEFPFIIDLDIYKENDFQAIFENTFISNQNNKQVIVLLNLFFYFLNFIHKSYLYKNQLKEMDIFFHENLEEVNDIGSLTAFLTACLVKINDLLANCFSKSVCLFETIKFEIILRFKELPTIKVEQFVNDNFIDLIDHLEKPYQDFEEAERMLDYDIPFSKGENYLLMSLSFIASKLPLIPNKEWKAIIIFMDEYESHLHLEWVRRHLAVLLWWLDKKGGELKVKFQLIVATHSPIIISDLPVDNITLLLETGIKRDKINYGFASNYYDILNDSFFLDDTIGEFAKQKINSCIRTINRISDRLTKILEQKKISHDSLQKFIKKNAQELERQNQIIDLVGDDVIKKQLCNMSAVVEERLLQLDVVTNNKERLRKKRSELAKQMAQIDQELESYD